MFLSKKVGFQRKVNILFIMIKENIKKILISTDNNISIVAATKTRSVDEIKQAVAAGIKIIGENYVQEAKKKYESLKGLTQIHLIGHLQKNKVRKAVEIFDMIQTLDSYELAQTIDAESARINKIMPVLIEINSARELQKNGVFGEDLEQFVSNLLEFKNIELMGIMTMGPLDENLENLRKIFKITKNYFDMIAKVYSGLNSWRYLSMGMSNSYNVAIEEGANMIRPGTIIFGER